MIDSLRDTMTGLSGQFGRSILVIATVALAGVSSIAVVGFTGGSRAEVSMLASAGRSPHVIATASIAGGPILPREFDRVTSMAAAASTAATTDQIAVNILDMVRGTQPGSADVVGVLGPIVTAAGLEVLAGRAFDSGHLARGERVALVGIGIAQRLGIPPPDGRASVFMNGYPYVILGTFTDGGSLSSLSSEVLVPDIALRRDFGPVPIRSVYVTANSVDDVGFVAEWTPLRLRPSRPNDIEVTRVGNDTTLAQAVDAELAQLSLIVVVVTTVLAAAIVAAVLTTSVVERRHEIGLRRALGATTRNIASMFASEGLLLGAAGSGFALVITAIAVLGVEFIWSVNFDIHPWFPWLVLAQGPVVGALGAIAPAVRASRLDPVDALGDR